MMMTQSDEQRVHRATPSCAHVQIIDSFDQIAEMREAWDQLVADTVGEVYASMDWCRIWWRHYGDRRELAIFIFRDGDRLVGVIPMFVERVRIGPVSIRIAKLVGSDHVMTVCAPPVLPTFAEGAFRTVLTAMLDTRSCDAVAFGRIAQTCVGLSALERVIRERQDAGDTAHTSVIGPLTVFELPTDYDAYLAAMKRRGRSELRRKRRRLAELYAVEEDVLTTPEQVESEFEPFRRLHDQQWQSVGKLGHFDDWPNAVEFHRDIVECLGPLGRVRIYRILLDGRVASYQYCFRFGTRLHWVLPARETSEVLRPFGLGRLALARMVDAALGEGITTVEGGVGHYPYKLQMGGHETELRSTLIVSQRRIARLRMQVFRWLGDALHLVYYRIYFGRVAPRLPWRQGPLWRSWIRSRL
jgi:CelD/BcsL family acetyltransferase involved in cellulose biosynthesis